MTTAPVTPLASLSGIHRADSSEPARWRESVASGTLTVFAIEVLSIVAQDLRNPLGSFMMQLSLLQPPHGRPEPRSLKAVNALERAVMRMSRILNDLVEIAKVESGRLDLDRTQVPAADFIGSISLGARAEGSEVVFWVADTGSGIPPEALPHLFDRDWHAKRSERPGSGIGLAIVNGTVQAHGGRVWVDSTVGVGSTFFFSLPVGPV